MKKIGEISAFVLNATTYAVPFVELEYTLKIISLCLSIASSLLLLAFAIWKWFVKSTEDGKITKEEIDEGINIITNGVKDIEEKIKDKEE